MDQVGEVWFDLLGPGDLPPQPLVLLRGPPLPAAAEPDEAFPEILPEHREHDQIKPGIRVAEHIHGVFDEVQVLEFPHVKNVYFQHHRRSGANGEERDQNDQHIDGLQRLAVGYLCLLDVEIGDGSGKFVDDPSVAVDDQDKRDDEE